MMFQVLNALAREIKGKVLVLFMFLMKMFHLVNKASLESEAFVRSFLVNNFLVVFNAVTFHVLHKNCKLKFLQIQDGFCKNQTMNDQKTTCFSC